MFLCCRLSRIKEASGSEVAERLLKDIMGKADFDMEEYDKAMAAAFDDEYYEVLQTLSSLQIHVAGGHASAMKTPLHVNSYMLCTLKFNIREYDSVMAASMTMDHRRCVSSC